MGAPPHHRGHLPRAAGLRRGAAALASRRTNRVHSPTHYRQPPTQQQFRQPIIDKQMRNQITKYLPKKTIYKTKKKKILFIVGMMRQQTIIDRSIEDIFKRFHNE